MTVQVHIKLFATLAPFTPESAEQYPIEPGTTVGELVQQLRIPVEKARLVFVDGVKTGLDAPLRGGERIGVFPPVGGG